MEGDGDGKRDLGWKYVFLSDPNNKNDVSCKLCQKVAKGGIYRLKQHLAGGYRNIKACNKCPEHVRQEIIEYMVSKKSERDQMNLLHESDKVADLEEEETEFFMTNDPRGKRLMSAALSQASVAKKARARQVGPMDVFCTPKAVTPQSGKQSIINKAYRKEQREKAAADVARWLYDAGIPFNVLNYPSFKVAMDSVARVRIGQKPLSAYEARVPLLRKEVQRTNDLMKNHREEWARTGCSIMSDGWEDRCHRSILNFLVNCSKGSMFIESVDASSYSKTGDRLYKLLSIIIEKVGEHNVVQVITDNGSNFVAAGALLEAKYPHLYWTPCAAHCIDLMLEDISKIPAIDRVLKRAIHMTSFIYQRPNLINLMRRFSGQRNLLRPAKTRFATAFITLSSIHKQRDNLRKLFTSQEWMALQESLAKFKKQQEKCQSTLTSIAASKTPASQKASKYASPSANTKSPAPAVKFSNDTERLQHINNIRKAPVGAQIKRVINLLFETRQAFTPDQINAACHVDVKNNKAVFESLKNNPKVNYDGRCFSYKSKHDLKDKKQLLVLVRKFPEGIPVIDLKDAYPCVMDDLQVLKSAGEIWLLSNFDSQEDIAYPNDPRVPIKVDDDLKELFKSIELPRDMLDIEKDLQKNGMKPATNTAKRRAAAQIQGIPTKPKTKKKKLEINKRTKLTNAHLPELFQNLNT